MEFYKKHLFFCVNQKQSGKKCCQDANAEAFWSYARTRVKALGLSGKGNFRVSKSGCLGRCSLGPSLVIYPEGTWYRYNSEADIDEIIERHLLHGEIVKRLLMDKPDQT